jgi:Uma2 family endonuclease
MASNMPRLLQEVAYEEAAQAYLRSLPLEHFMEAKAQGKQREITLESLALVKTRRPEVQVFNELLVQYPLPHQRQSGHVVQPRQRRLGQVVPDNMVVLSDQPVRAETSFNIPLESAKPFWMLEYVSKHNKRKDYEDNFRKYEQDLKVPYYLTFYPDVQELTLYRLKDKKYVSVPPNEQDRHPIPKLDLEVGLLEGWVRFWYQGELLPLPADLQRELDKFKRQAAEEKRRANREKQRADRTLRRADEETQRAEEEKRRAEDFRQRAEQEAAGRQAAERELAELRARLEQLQGRTRQGP